MNTLLFIAIVLVGVFVALALAKRRGGSREFPYQPTTYLLTKAERSFYGVLVQAVGTEGLVFAKVRVADVIIPKKGLSRSGWQRAFNAISAKHFDFLICDPQDCSVKAAVELDDSSHRSAKSQKRDRFLNGACESAGLPLLRIKASKSYTLADIKKQIAGAISPPSEVLSEAVVAEASFSKTETKHEAAPQTQAAAIESAQEAHKPAAPPCPRCGEPMLLRKAKSGSNAGQEFWGCSTFPKCRGVVKLNA
jgi:hypothetical protein